MANIYIFGATRRCFQSKEAFNVHTASKHHEQDPFPDQVKAAHFVMREKFVTPDVSQDKVSKFGDTKKTVPVSNINAYEAGKKKVIDTFESKVFFFRVIAETDDSDHEISNSVQINIVSNYLGGRVCLPIMHLNSLSSPVLISISTVCA